MYVVYLDGKRVNAYRSFDFACRVYKALAHRGHAFLYDDGAPHIHYYGCPEQFCNRHRPDVSFGEYLRICALIDGSDYLC